MELQAIREKLQLLQAEPPAAEPIDLPWSEPKSPAGLKRGVLNRNAHQPSKLSPQAAIDALKQRSLGPDPAASARIDHLVAQEIYRLEAQASTVNERSRQQAADIMALKRSAQQASLGLRRQGFQDHPQFAVITQFLENYPSAAVPYIERDDQGHFALTYDRVDFYRAEEDAIATAQALRNRRHASQPISLTPVSQPLADRDEREEGMLSPAANFSAESRRENIGKKTGKNAYSNNSFSWLDGTIWFSGAAIARIVIQSVVASHPIVQTTLLTALVGVIVFALYRVIVANSNDYGLVYRLCIGILGLFSAGLF